MVVVVFGPSLICACFYAVSHNYCEPSRKLQESFGPSGPEIPKESEKSLPGPPALGSQKVWKKSQKSPEETFSRLFPDFSDFFETFSRLFGALGPEAPGDFFQTLWGFRARRARETPVARGRVRNTIFARYVAKWGIAQMRLCEAKYQGGGIAPFWGSANLP